MPRCRDVLTDVVRPTTMTMTISRCPRVCTHARMHARSRHYYAASSCTSRIRGSRDEVRTRDITHVCLPYRSYMYLHLTTPHTCKRTTLARDIHRCGIYIVSSSSQKWSEVEATHSFPQQVFPTPPRVTPTSFCGSNSTARGGAARTGKGEATAGRGRGRTSGGETEG